MVKNIDGKAIAEKIKDGIAQAIYYLNGLRPNLAIILVGEREDSKLYVSLKQSEGKKVGVDTHLYEFAEETTEEELLKVIEFLNKDELIDGILVQLPLPTHFDTDKIIAALDPKKDVDGFHVDHPDYIVSPVLASIDACLEEIKFESKGKTACIFHNSEIFGLSVKKILEDKGMKIVLKEESDQADLIVTALGKPHFIKKEMIKDKVVIIDIGITKQDGKVLGDVDYEDVKEKASYITPVPGGIGPMTIAFLFKNALAAFIAAEKHFEK